METMIKNYKLEDWSRRWVDRETAFHVPGVNHILQNFFDQVRGDTVFVPLCGKTLDMLWLAQQSCTVVGVDGVETPVQEFFAENNLDYSVRQLNDDVKIYEAKDVDITIFICDLFASKPELFGMQFDLIWDRGSFVAINVDERAKYTCLLSNLLAPEGKWFLVTVDYDDKILGEPPRTVSEEDMRQFAPLNFTKVYSDLTKAYNPKVEQMIENAYVITK
uniref:thiopurine S-methyltransferase n=1 Tax=Plectus sambesii TaxID=2011161 RepID=A0A914VLA6_9BILA